MPEVRDFFVLSAEPIGMPAGIEENNVTLTVGPEDFELQQIRVAARLSSGPWSRENPWHTNLPLTVQAMDSASQRVFLPWTVLELVHLGPMPEPRFMLHRSTVMVSLKRPAASAPLFNVCVSLFGRKVFRFAAERFK